MPERICPNCSHATGVTWELHCPRCGVATKLVKVEPAPKATSPIKKKSA